MGFANRLEGYVQNLKPLAVVSDFLNRVVVEHSELVSATASVILLGIPLSALPEFMNFKLFGKTILVVNIKFGLFLGHPLSR